MSRAVACLAVAAALAFPAATAVAFSVARAAAAPVLAAVQLPGVTRVTSPPHGLSFTNTHGCRPRGDWSRVDPRVRQLLTRVAHKTAIRVSCLHTGHSRFVKGTRRVSNHTVWRAADIDMVGGQPVSRHNAAAHRLTEAIGNGAFGVQPSEVGSPWSFGRRPWFTDAGHQGHLHVGFRT